MAGPWERYGQGEPSPQSGPWSRYSASPASSAPQSAQGTAGIGSGFAMGLGDPVQGGAQLLANSLPAGVVDAVNKGAKWLNENFPVTRSLGMTPATPQEVNDQVTAREREYQATRGPDAGTDWARIGGNVASTVATAGRLPPASSLFGSVVGGAGTGAALSALNPIPEATTDNYRQKAEDQIAVGGVTGAVTGPIGYAIGRALSPNLDKNVRALADSGVQMTPGQMLGGTYRKLEDAATSLPVIGDKIASAQRNSVESLNRVAVNRAIAPIGEKIDDAVPVGRELVSAAADKVKAAYGDLLPKLKLVPDDAFSADVQNIAHARNLTPQMRGEFERFLAERVRPRLTNGTMDGETFKKIESELSRTAMNYSTKGGPAEAELGGALGDLLGSFRSLLSRSNPQHAERLSAINEAFAGMKRIEGAAASAGATEGVFSPTNLSQAVRQGDRSKGKSAYARGDALLQDLSDAAKATLPQSVPDSGTARRMMVNTGALAGGAGLLGAGAISPQALIPAAAVYGAYTQPMQRLAQALLARTPSAPTRAVGDASVRLGGAAAGPLAALLANGR